MEFIEMNYSHFVLISPVFILNKFKIVISVDELYFILIIIIIFLVAGFSFSFEIPATGKKYLTFDFPCVLRGLFSLKVLVCLRVHLQAVLSAFCSCQQWIFV
jgi:hypothetical protein